MKYNLEELFEVDVEIKVLDFEFKIKSMWLDL
jgi:hypothetical protein